MQVLCRLYVSSFEQGDSESRGSSRSRRRGEGPESSFSDTPYTYRYFPPGPEWFPSPMVPIAVQGPGDPLAEFALADTGADSTAFPLDRAIELGISLDDDCTKERVTTANGEGDQYKYPPGLSAVIEDTPFAVTAIFTDTPVIVLGQQDFFARFHATFCSQTETLVIRPYDQE